MEVILTDDVIGVGDIGETVRVRPGFARNYLLPRGLAFECGTRGARALCHKVAQIDAKKKKLKGSAEAKAGELRNTTLVMELRVGTGGKVFGSIGSRDIVRELALVGFEIDRKRVLLPEPIRRIGIHKVSLKLHAEVQTKLTVEVKPIAATSEQEELEASEAKQLIEELSEERGMGKNDSDAAE